MTDEELQAARKLCEQATPGPWSTANEVEPDRHVTFGVSESAHDTWFTIGPNTQTQEQARHDASFIAASRTLVPQLIDEVERREVCWSCPDCAFTFAAYHTLADGTLTCPVCEVERLRKERDEATAVIAAQLPHPNGPNETTPGDPEAWIAAMWNLGEMRRARDEALNMLEKYKPVAAASARWARPNCQAAGWGCDGCERCRTADRELLAAVDAARAAGVLPEDA